MSLYRLADGFSSADVEGMSLDPQAQDPDGYQNPRDLAAEPATDGQDPASPGGPAPYNGAEPPGQPVTTNPMWKSPDDPKKPPYSPTPYTGPGPSVDVTTLHNARRTPMEETMVADLWVLASQDAEQELSDERLVRAKVAAAGIWPFLAEARSEREFGHRVALVETELEDLFPDTGFRDQVTASLRDDYLLLTGALIEDHGTATLTSEAATAVQDGGAGAREALLATDAELEAVPSLFEHLALSESDVPDGGEETGDQGNPAFFDAGPEMGPATGNSGQFAQAAPDPFNPMNTQYPMTPSQWTIPPGKDWVERPMEFGKQGSAGYVDEGVQTGTGRNPEYFAAPEGVTNGQQGFPPDVSLPEPDERADWYGSVPPQTDQPAAPAPPYSNTHSGARFVVAEKDNHGACAHCNSPVYRDGDVWKHLTGDPGHGVRLHEDHPWVQAQQANRVMAVRHTAPGGGEHAPYEIREVEGGYAVFNAKGERKNEEPKSHDEARQYQKALYKNVPGASESAKKAASVRTARDFSQAERDEAAKSGHALSDGSFPIYSAHDVKAAKDRIGTTDHDRETVVRHINHWAEQYDQPKVGETKTSHLRVARWVLAEASSSDTGPGNTDPASVDPMGAPSTPQSMEAGGAGAVAGPPLTIPNDTVSTHPFAGQNAPQEPATTPGMSVMAARYVVADTMNRPTAENPLGVESGDEFDLNNWNKPAEQRPRQDADARKINTPQRPGQPIPVRSSDGAPGEEEEDDEEEERR